MIKSIKELTESQRYLNLRIPVNLPMAEIQNYFPADKINDIFVLIDAIFTTYKLQGERGYYVNIHSHVLKSLFNSYYRKLIEGLVDLEIIQVNETYRKDHFAKSYHLNKIYFKHETRIEQIYYPIMVRKMYNLKYIKYSSSRVCDFLDEKINNLNFDEKEITEVLESNTLAQESIKAVKKMKNIFECNKIKNSDALWQVQDRKTGRVYNTITNLCKAARSSLRYNGNKLVELDIKNCQPALLASFYKDDLIEHSEEREKYLKIVQEDLYEFLNLRRTVPFVSRKNLKGECFKRIFYGSLKSACGEMWETFVHHFPILGSIIRHEKEKLGKSGFACKIQKMEAGIVVYGLLNIIMDKHPKWGIFTIHDGVLVEQQHVEQCKKYLEQVFFDITGYTCIVNEK